jgi:hypothetical protein
MAELKSMTMSGIWRTSASTAEGSFWHKNKGKAVAMEEDNARMRAIAMLCVRGEAGYGTHGPCSGFAL